MKYLTYILLFAGLVISFMGCEKKQKPEGQTRKAEIGVLKDPVQMKATLSTLAIELGNKADLQKEIEQTLQQYGTKERPPSGESQLRDLYALLADPNASVSAAKSTLLIFTKMEAQEIIRESLLHKNPDVVIIATNALVDQAKAGVKDKESLPYLIYVLEKKNYPVQGSEAAAIHEIMKRKLIESIQQITNLDIKVSEINVDSIEEVERVLSLARKWANQKGIKLFKK